MIYFIDCDDSFNFNIIDRLKAFGEVKIIHHTVASHLKYQSKDIFILGPGPGHIDEYSHLFKFIRKIYNQDLFLFGICLGHQLILKSIYDCEVKRCKRPVHGKSVLIPELNTRVMRYNSWFVEADTLDINYCKFDELGELAIFDNRKSIYSVQFHPESIGTSCPEAFFEPLQRFLRYSIDDEYANSVRHL